MNRKNQTSNEEKNAPKKSDFINISTRISREDFALLKAKLVEEDVTTSQFLRKSIRKLI
jgi:hypothetical protein